MLNKFNKKIINKLPLALSTLFKRIFNPLNISKALIIFIFGLVSRILVNSIYDINVFTEYTETISLVYYSTMALFVVFINELVTYFNFSFISSFHIDSLFSFKSKINLGSLKISTLKKAVSSFLSSRSDAITLNGVGFKSTDNSVSNDKLSTVLFNGDKNGKVRESSGRNIKGHSSGAGISGLYPTSGTSINNKSNSAGIKALYNENRNNVLPRETNNVPIISRVKCRLI